VNTPIFSLFFANFSPYFYDPPTLIRPPSVIRQCGDDDGSEGDDGINRSNGGAMIFGGVGAMLMMPKTNNAAASTSIASFATAWSTTPPLTTPPPTAAATTTIWGGGDAVVTDEEYNYLALMVDDGLLRVGGQPVDIDERGCGAVLQTTHRSCNRSNKNIMAAQASSSTRSCHLAIKRYRNCSHNLLFHRLFASHAFAPEGDDVVVACSCEEKDVMVDCLFWWILLRWCVKIPKTIIFSQASAND
jgi:hypothetical protein